MADKEYIERGALLDSLKKQYGEELGWQCTVNMSDVGMMIEDAPAADVVEVRHGEWKDRGVVKRANTANAPFVECSECHITFCDLINNHHFMYRYCPYCGAKMEQT